MLVVKGVFVQWTTDLPNAKVRSWNVSELRVSGQGTEAHEGGLGLAFNDKGPADLGLIRRLFSFFVRLIHSNLDPDPWQIDPSKRHIDKSTVANFWRELESWIAMHKPHLSY